MAEEEDQGGEKSYEPSPQKLEDARKRGDVARSQDISAFAAYLGLLIAVGGAGAVAVAGFGDAATGAFSRADRLAPALLGSGGDGVALGLVGAALLPLSPFFAAPFAVSLAVILAQNAFVFAPGKLSPKLSRISIIANAKQKFGLSGIVAFAKATVKLTAISAVLFFYLFGRTEELIGLARAPARAAPGEMAALSVGLFWRIAVIAGAIAVVDYLWQRVDHARKLRMTYQELREEQKRAEGDPAMKSQRRRRAEEIATNRMMMDVPDADVVIVNPTHYAVALKWRRGADAAPRVVAKGVDAVAMRIREAAAAAGVPIRDDPPTARALEAAVGIGEEVPPQHYKAVAAAIRFAEAMRVRAKARGL